MMPYAPQPRSRDYAPPVQTSKGIYLHALCVANIFVKSLRFLQPTACKLSSHEFFARAKSHVEERCPPANDGSARWQAFFSASLSICRMYSRDPILEPVIVSNKISSGTSWWFIPYRSKLLFNLYYSYPTRKYPSFIIPKCYWNVNCVKKKCIYYNN